MFITELGFKKMKIGNGKTKRRLLYKEFKWTKQLLFKQYKTFPVFASPDISTRGVGRIRDSINSC